MSIASARTVPTYPDPGESSPYEVTYDDYMAMPETNRHVEVVDGVIHVTAAATPYHQKVSANIQFELEVATRRTDLGLVLPAPLDVVIRRRPKLRVRQPDLVYYSNARAGFRVGDRLDLILDGTHKPDLVVEVLSPGQDEQTLSDKLADYASIEVEEVWFADQDAKSIRVLVRDGGGYRLAGEYGTGAVVLSTVLSGIRLQVATLFA